MQVPTLRIARLPDAYPIALMSRVLVESGLSGWSWDPQRVARSIQARDTVVLVATVKHPIIGFAIMNFGDAQAHLSLLAVSFPYQRCGIGRCMMAWLEESALTAGIATINLELRLGNNGAREFYRAIGYSETACIPGYYRGTETALRMSRDIRRAVSDPIR